MKHFSMFVLGLFLLFAATGALAADAVPTVTSPNYVTALVGQPFSYRITATGNPTSFSSYYLDFGSPLTYDQSKGQFSGVPTHADFLSQPISATNGSGTGNGHLTIDIEYDLNLTRLYDIGYYPRLEPGVLTLGADGNFYNNGLGYDGSTCVLSISPQGQVLQFYRVPDDYFFAADLITDQAGNFYGTLKQNMEPIAPPRLVRLSAAGQLSILHQFTDAQGEDPRSRLCLAHDGSLYGYIGNLSTVAPGFDGATVFRLSPDGTYTIVHRFDGATEGLQAFVLVEAADGNLYGTAQKGGPGGGGTIFKMTPDGVVTVLQSFSSDALISNPAGPLTVGSDGNLYGTIGNLNTTYTATNVPQSAFFRVVPGGAVTIVRSVDPSKEGQRYPNTLVRGADGVLYGLGQRGQYPFLATQDLRRYALDGTSVSIHRFADDQSVFADTPTVGADGNFYCLAGDGGNLGQYGSFVRIASQPSQSNHPGFFGGELTLTNGVSYLPLENGNIFGYYGYLSDPHFIYHFDMGYEYWFDAADGHDGIYFYDFASNTFWYTSPTFPFPYLYDFSLQAFLYYYPDPNDPSHYNSNGVRYFYNFSTGQIISK